MRPWTPLTPRDRERLRGVHPDLVRVVERARRDVPFLVAEGRRSVERQRELIRSGASRIPLAQAHLGRHVTGHAVDLYPIGGTPIPQMTMRDMRPVYVAMRAAAADLGISMRHGYDWGWDPAHHELHPEAYPA